jgi:hypothetical protein
MATYTVSRNDLQAPAERLMNRARSPIMDNMPETQRDMKLAALFLQDVTTWVAQRHSAISLDATPRPGCKSFGAIARTRQSRKVGAGRGSTDEFTNN